MNFPNELQQKLGAAARLDAGLIGGVGALSNSESLQSSRPSTEIEGCLSRANNALERLHSRISAVEDRVRPVMRSIGQGQKGGPGAPTEALSPLGDAIASIEGRVDTACDRLEALLAGLAL